MVMVTGPSWSPLMRLNSASARAGMMTLYPAPLYPAPLVGAVTGSMSGAVRTDKRNPSEAANRTRPAPDESFSNLASTPVKIGRLSSVAAAKTTWLIIVRSVSESMRIALASSAPGMRGKSVASMPRTLFSNRPHLRFSVCVRTTSSMSTRSAGSAPTRSTNVRAGTVVAPSSSTFAPIQQVMPISRLVAESFKRPWSVASRMLLSTGNVERVATARPTTDKPLARFS